MARLSSPLYGGLLPDGNVNQKLVKQGWCWWYRKYAPRDTVLEGLEKEAGDTRKACGLSPSLCRRGNGGRGGSWLLTRRIGLLCEIRDLAVCEEGSVGGY